MNNGDETFTKINLPIEVQFSPVYAILVDDFDKDGFQDMLTGGNFSGVPPELGRYDASYGNVLLGEGTGSFKSASLQSSGFIVTEEIRQMKKIKTPNNQNQILVVRNNNTTVIFNQLQNKWRAQFNKNNAGP